LMTRGEWMWADHDHDYDMSEHEDRVFDVEQLWTRREECQSNRRLQRASLVAVVAEQARIAINPLWIHDDGYIDEGYDGPNIEEWDELYPVAQEGLEALQSAVAAVIELAVLAALLRERSRVLELLATADWVKEQPEPVVPPPSRLRRAEPDLALAPPLSHVVLSRDDASAAHAA
jgi:hypothetical protein